MNKRNLKLDKYGISKKRYKELCGFCEQYPEWKAAIKDYSFVKGISYDPIPKSVTNGFHSSTEDAAIRIEKYLENCNFVEKIAKKASPDYWEYLIKGVCFGVNTTYLIGMEDMPMSKDAYYDRRRYFFYLLDKEKI